MQLLICIFPIIVIISILFFLKKYSGIDPYEKTHAKYYREKQFTEYSPIVWSYILNKKFKKSSIIANVLLYVKKGYITMEKEGNDYKFQIIKKLDVMNNLDLFSLDLFFLHKSRVGTIQYLKNFNRYFWIEKYFGNYKIFKKETNKQIREYLKENKIVDYMNEKQNIGNVIYGFIVITLVFGISVMASSDFSNIVNHAFSLLIGYFVIIDAIKKHDFSLAIIAIPLSSFYFVSGGFDAYKLGVLVTYFLVFFYIYISNKVMRIKGKNGEVIEKALGLKRFIKNYSNMKQYDLNKFFIWDEYFIYAVVFNLNKIKN